MKTIKTNKLDIKIGQLFFFLYVSLKMDQPLPPFLSVDGVLSGRTRGGKMVGADESTKLWRLPFVCFRFFIQHFYSRPWGIRT